MQIYTQQDSLSAAAEAGENLNKLLLDHVKQPMLLLLSGGSAFNILDYTGTAALSSNLTISVLDERFSEDSGINNFFQLQKTDFYKDAFEKECNFFGTMPRPNETKEDLAKRWEKNLKNWRTENPDGLIIATLGMGPDGHTAGIFPYPENQKKFNELFNGSDWIASYNADDKNKYPNRVTTTLTFLKTLDIGLAYVCGADKKEKLSAVISKTGKLNELPALIWQEIKNLKMFTDLP